MWSCFVPLPGFLICIEIHYLISWLPLRFAAWWSSLEGIINVLSLILCQSAFQDPFSFRAKLSGLTCLKTMFERKPFYLRPLNSCQESLLWITDLQLDFTLTTHSSPIYGCKKPWGWGKEKSFGVADVTFQSSTTTDRQCKVTTKYRIMPLPVGRAQVQPNPRPRLAVASSRGASLFGGTRRISVEFFWGPVSDLLNPGNNEP